MERTVALPGESAPARPAAARGRRGALQSLLRNRAALVSLGLLAALVGLAALAPLIAPADPVAQDVSSALLPPSGAHPLGTDSFGRDVLSRVIFGARTSLLVGGASVAVAVLLGVPLGLVAGYAGQVVDDLVMRVMDALLSFPPILLAIAIMAGLGPDSRNVVLALGLVYTPVFARLARGSTLSVKEEEYVQAARALGAGPVHLLLRHVLPNIASPLIVQASASFAVAIVAEATLSFLGLGTQPPYPSWGLDLNEGRRFLEQAYWLVLAPAAAISVSVLALSFFGDGLREALDPRLQRD